MFCTRPRYHGERLQDHWSSGFQGWDKYCPAGKFQLKMLEKAGRANIPKITEVANTGIFEKD